MTIQIHRKSKSLILPTALQDFIVDLPHKKVVLDGKEFVAVKHDETATTALRQAGLECPSPVLTYHNLPLIGGRWKPFDHQLKTIEFFTLNKRCICLNEMGLGKSASALLAADYLMSIGEVHRVLILSPLSTLDCVWANEIFNTLPDRTYSVIYGSATKRKQLLSYKTDFAVLNHEGLAVVYDELFNDKSIDLLIVDESSVYRNSGTERYKKLKNFLQPRHRFWAMSGSPTPTAPTDCWSIARIINPNGVNRFFGAFRKETMYQITPFKWAARKGAEHIVKKALSPSIRFKKSECLDLPPQIFERREASLTPEQDRIFKSMKAKMEADIGDEKLTAVNAAAKFGVLRQILGGCYKVAGEEAQYNEIDCQPRLNAMLEAIEESETKVIVFVPYTGMLHMVAKTIAKHHTVKIIEGDTAGNERNQIIQDFQTQENPRVIVASDRCISHGVTLTEADTVIWYCPTTSADAFAQANARVDRPGQTRTTTVVLIGTHKFEWAMYDGLKDKLDMQQLVLDLMGELNLA